MTALNRSMTRPWFLFILALGFLLAFALGFIMCGPSGKNAPDLVGLSIEDGKARAESEGFTLEVDGAQHSQEPEGTIIAQDPEPGANMGKDGKIRVIVSKGEQEGLVRIPDLVGMTETDARVELERLGMSVSVTYEQNPAYAEGIVAGQEPAEGEEAQVGGSVTLTVAKKGTAANKGVVVCLDPGHANTPSQIDEDTGLNTMDWANEPEIQIVFDIAIRARDMLEARGVRVVMTKQSVYDPVDLKQRAVIANDAGAALILHIHTDPGISSPSTFYPGAGELGWKANSDTGRKAYIDPQVQQESERIAKVFHAAMATYMQDKYGTGNGGTIVENRGATGTGNYGPIFSYDVWSRIPTFTIENNQSFADSNRQAVAEGIVEGIMACLEDL